MLRVINKKHISLMLFSYIIFILSFGGNSLEFNIFDNAYELQEKTGYDLGFRTRSIDSFGGTVYNVNSTIHLGETSIFCDDSILEIRTQHGIIVGGRLFCPVSEHKNIKKATQLTKELISKINSNSSFFIYKNFLPYENDKIKNISDLFSYLVQKHTNSQNIQSLPILTWRNNKQKGSIQLYAAIRMRGGDNRLRYYINYSYYNSCLDHIRDYQLATSGFENYKKKEHYIFFKNFFNNRIYNEIPDKERTFLTHNYIKEFCVNDKVWD